MSSRNARRRRRAPRGTFTPAAGRTRPGGAAKPSGRGSAAPRPGGHLDPVAVYRASAFVGRTPRLGLLAGLGCLAAFGALRSAHQTDPATLGNIGSGLVLAFLILSWLGYLRVIYKVRREDPGSWRPSRSMYTGLLGAPLGIGDPRATAYDRAVLWLTAIAAAALLPLSLLH